jgi:hypothetical protein
MVSTEFDTGKSASSPDFKLYPYKHMPRLLVAMEFTHADSTPTSVAPLGLTPSRCISLNIATASSTRELLPYAVTMQFQDTRVRLGISSNRWRASGRQAHLAYMSRSEVRTKTSEAAPASRACEWRERPRRGRRSAAQDLAREGKVEASPPRRPAARRDA